MLIAPVDLRNSEHLSGVYSVCQAAFSLEAALLRCHDFPPLKETPAALAASQEQFLAAWDGPMLLGVLGFVRGQENLHISRLAVAPERMRQGVGSLLLGHFVPRYPHEKLTVMTGSDNAPAIRLYQKFGFEMAETWLAPEGIMLVRLVRPANIRDME